MIRPLKILLAVSACFASAAFLTCYAPALFGDRQFGYRDAGHYYYPLYQRVQEEWNAGRWPLWEREENAGMPLLGNPTAAVLYPGKLVFAILPYAWGARVYVVAHTALAFVAMLVLMRSWRTSWVGSALSALSYSFGTPILFQYSNVIYLVGAAWLPLGFHAVDRWVRLGRRWGLVELAIVLAMQTLGGDPQSAYILGWAAGGYAAGIAWSRAREVRSRERPETGDSRPAGSSRLVVSFPLVVIGLLFWVAATLALAMWLPQVRPPRSSTPGRSPGWPGCRRGWRRPGDWPAWGFSRTGDDAAGGSPSASPGWDWPCRPGWRSCSPRPSSCPVIEFIEQTVRAAVAGPHDLYRFSIEPFRLVELALAQRPGCPFRREHATGVTP